MYDTIQDALDDVSCVSLRNDHAFSSHVQLTSPRSSLSRKGRALGTLEGLVADIYVSDRPGPLDAFLSLQDSFQCNSESANWFLTTFQVHVF